MPEQRPTPLLKLTSTIRDEATNEYFVTFLFRNAAGKTTSVELPRSLLADSPSLIKKLLSNGAVLPPKPERVDFVEDAVDSASAKVLTRSSHSGWRTGRKTFVSQARVIGKAQSTLLGIRPPDRLNERGWLHVSGTLAAWKRAVAKPATSSSHFMLAIAAAFGAPLLRICKQQSFSICISGATRSGKSVATVVGGSVIGLERDDRLPTWNTTEAGLEEHLPRLRDCLFPIDVTGYVKDRAECSYVTFATGHLAL